MARCKACGNGTGFSLVNHFVPDDFGKKHIVCKDCVDAAERAGKWLKYDPKTDTVITISKGDAEIRKKCRTCGHVMCFTTLDKFNSQQAAKNARLNAMTSAANALNGHYAASAVNQANANSQVNQIRDFNKCPNCGSIDLVELKKGDYERELQKANNPQPATSPADDLKRYKELLDMGIITQEEFDAKKKQLLGL